MVRIDGLVWLTVAEAAAVLEVGADHVRHLVRKGTLTQRRDLGALHVERRSVVRYQATRGPWRAGGVVGGRAAQVRLGMERARRAQCR